MIQKQIGQQNTFWQKCCPSQKTHKAKHPNLVILYAFHLAPSMSLKICTLRWFVTLCSPTLFVTQAVASSVSERHSILGHKIRNYDGILKTVQNQHEKLD